MNRMIAVLVSMMLPVGGFAENLAARGRVAPRIAALPIAPALSRLAGVRPLPTAIPQAELLAAEGLPSQGEETEETLTAEATRWFDGRAAFAAAPVLGGLAQSGAVKAAAGAGYYAGNGIALVLDIPRLYGAARSRDPKAVSVGSNAILMASSIIAAARSFLGLESLLAWQNLLSGVLPMAIVLLKNERTRKLFPSGRESDSAAKDFPRAVALKRMALLCLIGALPTALLGAAGALFLTPLSATGASAGAQLMLQILATAFYIPFLIPQIRQIRKTQTTDGVSPLFMRALLVMGICFGVWSLQQAGLNAGATFSETIRSMAFWKYAIYAVEKACLVYFAALTLRVMAQTNKPPVPR